MANLTLVFDEYPDDEIVLRISPVPLADYFEVADLRNAARWAREDFERLARRFAEVALVSWTFPEPADAEGILRRDPNLIVALVGQWLKGVVEVPLPLPVTSSAGTAPTRETSPDPSPAPSS